MCAGTRTTTRADTRRDVTDPLDDPTCHDCLIAQMLREQRDDLLAEIAVLKGTTRLPGDQRVSHGTQADEPK